MAREISQDLFNHIARLFDRIADLQDDIKEAGSMSEKLRLINMRKQLIAERDALVTKGCLIWQTHK